MNPPTDFPEDLLDAVSRLENEGVVAGTTPLAEVASTNSWAMSRLKQPAIGRASHAANDSLDRDKLPHLVIAGKQTAGRGRRGRTWLSSNDSLTFSLVLPKTALLLPIAAGVAIAEALGSWADQPIGIKWPNDVVVQSEDDGQWRKVAGVLIETVQHQTIESSVPPAVVIGVGVNVNQCPHDLPEGGLLATSMSAASSSSDTLDRGEVLAQLVESILDRAGGLPWQTHVVLDAFRQSCILTGHVVRVQRVPGTGHDELTGICQGIDSEGNLTVLTPEGPQAIASGEVLRTRWTET